MNEILRMVFIIYFVTHIPITLCLDLQALLGEFYPVSLKDFHLFYVSTYNDPLMRLQPIWFKSFIFLELIFQLPFFFAASYGLIYRKNWIRIPSIIYGTHVATTLVPILASFAFGENTINEKITLASFYLPYLIIPILLVVSMLNGDPFVKAKTK
eukprot:gene4608-6485_t